MTTYEQPKDWIERHLVEDPGGLLACEPSGLNEELKLARQANEFQHQQLAALNEHQISYETQMEQQLAAKDALLNTARELISRYRFEIPPGRQPHMICLEAEDCIAAIDKELGE